MKTIRLTTMAIILFAAFAASAFAGDVQRLDKDVLKADMGSYIIVDARRGSDWNGSEFKIQGAVRPKGGIVDFAQSEGWAKDAKITIYCA